MERDALAELSREPLVELVLALAAEIADAGSRPPYVIRYEHTTGRRWPLRFT